MSERDEGVVRMDAGMWGLVAEMYAVQARIEGMKAANRGDVLVYDKNAFDMAERELYGIANALHTRI